MRGWIAAEASLRTSFFLVSTGTLGLLWYTHAADKRIGEGD